MTTVLLSVLLYTYFFLTIISFCAYYTYLIFPLILSSTYRIPWWESIMIVSFCISFPCVFLWWASLYERPTWSAAIIPTASVGWCVLYGGTSHPSTKCRFIQYYILWGYTGYFTGTSKKYSKHSSSAGAKKNRTLNTACSNFDSLTN